ncbi:nickel pincer cofactor biosynthesis protein LarC [Paenibacillus tarimensis]
MMGKHLYLDCGYGIAGDMMLAALIDAGADIDYITSHLWRLPFDPFELSVAKVVKKGIAAKHLVLTFPKTEGQQSHPGEGSDHGLGHDTAKDHNHGDKHHHQHDHHEHHDDTHYHDDHDHDHSQTHKHDHDHNDHHHHGHHHHGHHHHGHHHHVHGDHEHENHAHGHRHDHRKAADIIAGIERSELPLRVKSRSILVFRAIAEAEGKIHGLPPEEVHFHEVGAMDSIIDIIGICLALENLDIDSISASPVPTGSGKAKMAHGLYPIPAPATAELLCGIPLVRLYVTGELTTPTGAGILRALSARFGPLPEGIIDRIGYGAGTKDFDHPNVLRCFVMSGSGESEKESVTILEAQLDDCTGEMMGYTMERLFGAGALDVYFTSVYMKKNRPGVLISVLCKPEHAPICEQLLLTETTTLGVRSSTWSRTILERRHIRADTPFGPVRIKQALRQGIVVHQAPEYEDAAQAARTHGIPLQAVYEEALRAIK